MSFGETSRVAFRSIPFFGPPRSAAIGLALCVAVFVVTATWQLSPCSPQKPTFLAFPSQPVRIFFTCFSFPGNHSARPISKASYRPIHARVPGFSCRYYHCFSPIGLAGPRTRNIVSYGHIYTDTGDAVPYCLLLLPVCVVISVGRFHDNGLRRFPKKDSTLSIQYRGFIDS